MAKKKKPSWKDRKPVLAIAIKFAVIALLIFAGIYYSDSKGYFTPDNRNNHTKRKWDAYYDFSKKKDVDVLLVGNSHLYTGINPKNLSTSLGCNAFILASPGTRVVDHYYALEEALKANDPKVVVIETYGLSEVEQYALKDGILSDQLKSFSARKNISSKIRSTPYIFAPKNYPYAWSNTLRNHDYLFSDYEQIEKNIEESKKRKKKDRRLYLGRYVRFTTGLEDSLITMYDNLGAPVDGLKYEINQTAEKYIHKITDLCKSKDIEVVFLTLPMYEKHISNYSAWKGKLSKSLGKRYSSNEYWLDLQEGNGYKGFSKHSFENTYKENQHMTYNGSLLATYKLRDFLLSKSRIKLSDRSRDKAWRDLFYNQEGFFENHTPNKGDKNNIVLHRTAEKTGIKEVLHLKRGKFNTLLAKYIASSEEEHELLKTKKIRISVNAKLKDQPARDTYIDLPYDQLHSGNGKMNFSRNTRPLEILKVYNISIVD